jgi:hypothetical protein
LILSVIFDGKEMKWHVIKYRDDDEEANMREVSDAKVISTVNSVKKRLVQTAMWG